MNLSFSPKKTNDGSIGLYNAEVDDIYHSTYGAYAEALEKFIKPSNLESYVINHSKVRILDVCSGMGYNLKAAINAIMQANSDCIFEIDCLEIDSYVFAFGLLYKVEQIDYDVHYFLIESFLQNSDVLKSMVELVDNDKILPFLDPELCLFLALKIYGQVDLMVEHQKKGNLHNIYYKYMSNRHKNPPKRLLKFNNNKVQVFIDDARKIIQNLQKPYNIIFHDGFTPSKQSILWTEEFFAELKILLYEDGCISTYSSSAPVRCAMLKNGFLISKISTENRRTSGTVASLKKENLQTSLNEEEYGILKTKSGIVYSDECFSLSHDEIIKRREEVIKKSELPSASSYLKKFKRKSL